MIKVEEKVIPNRFTIRVYGLLINHLNEVLISHESIKGFNFSKFPGGGLEFGEGTLQCLLREFEEETGLQIKIKNHIYTSDFFIQSHFDDRQQVLGIYYEVEASPDDIGKLQKFPKKLPFEDSVNEVSHSWVSLNTISAEDLTFDMDRVALEVFKKFLM